MVDVDVTSDTGMPGTGSNGAVDLTNKETEDGSNNGSLTDDRSISNGGTETMDGLEGSTNGTKVLVSSLDVW